jgi:hypothetical protein
VLTEPESAASQQLISIAKLLSGGRGLAGRRLDLTPV